MVKWLCISARVRVPSQHLHTRTYPYVHTCVPVHTIHLLGFGTKAIIKTSENTYRSVRKI